MLEDPDLDVSKISACLETEYDLRVVSIVFLPLGYDSNAAVYEVITWDGTAYFLKIRAGPVFEPGLLVPRALIDRGITNVLAPLRTRASDLWCSVDGYSLVLYPFVKGRDAMVAAMSDDQWRVFGSTLQAIHSSGLGEDFRGHLRRETFALPSAALVRRLLSLIDGMEFESAAAARFAAFWRENAERIGDIHAANILVGDDGRIYLIDWDGPLIAPRERDLLFVIGSRIARVVEPREERLFFDGYGAVEIDPEALIYYRYERIIEDLGEFGQSVFLDQRLGERARTEEAELAMSFFAPGGDIDGAETVSDATHSRFRERPGGVA